MIRVIVNGHLGALGRAVTSLVENQKGAASIVAGIDIIKTKNSAPFPSFGDISECDMPADVILDVSHSEAVPKVLDYAVKKRTNLVICTTGLSDETNASVLKAAESIAVFKSPNMSLGINLIKSLLKRAAGLLYEEGFDIEILEKHHNKKLDAPSGTAIALAETVNKSLGNKLRLVYDRSGYRERRSHDELGMHAIRGGTVVGEHSVIFAGHDEVIELRHTAYSKEIFAIGAIKAVKFLYKKPCGLYGMDDLTEEVLA